MLTLEQINTADHNGFTQLLDGTYEHSPWIAEGGWAQRPFASLVQIKAALARVVRESTPDRQLALIRAHPELAGKAMVSKSLTVESTNEQGKAGLTDCTPEEFAAIQRLNTDYNDKFGFPFILAVRGPRGLGLSKVEIIATFERRLGNHVDFERAECLRNIHRIAEVWLNDKFGFAPDLGNQVWDWAERLAAHSDSPYAERGELTVTYLTDAHRACAQRLAHWMRADCGFDEVGIDAVGNVVGIYHGAAPEAKRLMTGSHYDTVRNGGKYDGRLGPGWLLEKGFAKPDLLIAAGFSYQVVTAHNGCLQMEVTVHGKMGHAAVPETAVDALQAANWILTALYEQNTLFKQVTSKVKGITHPYLNVGLIQGGTNTNVVPGTVVLKLDRRMIPEENPTEVEATLRRIIADAVANSPGITIDIKRLLMAHALTPLAGNQPLVQSLCKHASEIFGESIEGSGTPLYTDARLFSEQGIPAVLYGCGPRSVLKSNAKRADEHIDLEDLRRATKVVARTLAELLE